MPLHLKLKPIHVPFRAADMQRIQVYVTLTIMIQKRTLRSLPMLACTHTQVQRLYQEARTEHRNELSCAPLTLEGGGKLIEQEHYNGGLPP